MPAHIHPYLQWFTCETRPVFNGLVYPGSVSRPSQGPPRAQSPFARWRRYLNRRGVSRTKSEGVTPPSSLLWTHATGQNPPVLFVYLIRRVLAGCCQSLLGVGLSRRYLCNPCIGAWTLTPGCLSGASVRFFPESYSLTTVAPSSAHPTLTAAMPLSTTTLFRGGSHSVMFRLPCLLAPQMAPTAQTRSPTGSRDVYATQWTGRYRPELWYRYMTESDNYHGGTFTRRIAALSAATCNVRVHSL